MRIRWLLLLGGLVAACGGNFSNDDLEFLNALPAREDLAAKLPAAEASVTAGSLRQRKALLSVGDVSQLYLDTRQASDEFNGGLDGMLAMLEQVRHLTPSQRAEDVRLWGPLKDSSHSGHEARLLMKRDAEIFAYWVQFRPEGGSEESWWNLVEGGFRADGGLRKGEGLLVLRVSEARARGLDVGDLSSLDTLEIRYQTREVPLQVEMRFVPASTQLTPELRYAHREVPGGPGEMGFLLRGTDVIPGGQKEDLLITSRWTRDRGGVGTMVVTGGDVPSSITATHVECWDASFRVTYIARSWEGTAVGDASSCPDVSALGE